MIVTQRLILRPFIEGDASFILELVNDRDWIRFIGDRGVGTTDEARRYLVDGPMRLMERDGHSLMLVSLRSNGEPGEALPPSPTTCAARIAVIICAHDGESPKRDFVPALDRGLRCARGRASRTPRCRRVVSWSP